jgi:hypothetical protein
MEPSGTQPSEAYALALRPLRTYYENDEVFGEPVDALVVRHSFYSSCRL